MDTSEPVNPKLEKNSDDLKTTTQHSSPVTNNVQPLIVSNNEPITACQTVKPLVSNNNSNSNNHNNTESSATSSASDNGGDQGPQLHKWTVSEVCEFIRNLPGCSDYAEDFENQEIDGQALLLLKPNNLVSVMGIKLGPALKIIDRVNVMRGGSQDD